MYLVSIHGNNRSGHLQFELLSSVVVIYGLVKWVTAQDLWSVKNKVMHVRGLLHKYKNTFTSNNNITENFLSNVTFYDFQGHFKDLNDVQIPCRIHFVSSTLLPIVYNITLFP